MAEKFSLGEKVTVRRVLRREHERRSKRRGGLGHEIASEWRVWKAYSLPKPVEGYVVGMRTLMNIERVYIGYDEGWDNNLGSAERFRALLVVFDINQKPIYALPEDVERG